MFTSSSTLRYSHDLVRVLRPEYRIDYGWYAHIQHDCDSRTLRIHRVIIPKYDHKIHLSSPQSVFFKNMLDCMDEELVKKNSMKQVV